MDVLATRSGEEYFGFKWLPENLKRLGQPDEEYSAVFSLAPGGSLTRLAGQSFLLARP